MDIQSHVSHTILHDWLLSYGSGGRSNPYATVRYGERPCLMGTPGTVEVKVRRARAHVDPLPLPAYASEAAAGLDLRADIDEAVAIVPGGRALIPTGLVIELPYGYEAQIRPRSGLALRHGVTLLNAPGTVDADYRGEIQVILINLGEEVFEVRRGDRIAQMVVARVSRVSWQEQQSLSVTVRGSGGFGHTGRNLREPREK